MLYIKGQLVCNDRFFWPNLGLIGNPRSVLESAHQDNSKTKETKIDQDLMEKLIATKLCLLLVLEKIKDHNSMASITNSILDQIKLPGGVLESSCQSNSKTFIRNPISLRFGRENKGTYCCSKLTAPECTS